MTSRDRFEAWARANGYDGLDLRWLLNSNGYYDSDAQAVWTGWQAREATLDVEAVAQRLADSTPLPWAACNDQSREAWRREAARAIKAACGEEA